MQVGSAGVNFPGKSCLGPKKPLPEEIAKQYLYGISGVAFNLKDYSKFSICYQVFVQDVRLAKNSF